MADPTQVHQIAMNLITNAFHVMKKTGGKLSITLEEVELKFFHLNEPSMNPGAYARLMVSDSGPGMSRAVMERVFDPSFTTKEEGKGTDLGLSVVHGIVRSHGGQISVHSEPGKGATFKVNLPVIQQQPETAQTKIRQAIEKGNERILLIDDQASILDIEKQMVERLGYHVTICAGSLDALETFTAQPDRFDLVITDLTMPDMTGDKLGVELIKIRSNIPVILCTGFNESMIKEKARSIGFSGFLMKPEVMGELSKIIRKILDNK